MTSSPSIYPVLSYADLEDALRFLTSAFGFTEHEVTRSADGALGHCELAHGNSLVMLHPKGAGGVFDLGPCVVYIVVEDVDAHHARAVEAGAEIVMAPTDSPHGSRDYAARDAEGNVWSFGTYRPEL